MNVAEKALKDFFGRLIEFGALPLLTKLSSFLTKQNIKSYVVGGFIRDILLERDTADIDLAIAADALEIAPKIATALGGKYIPLDKINRTGRVILISKEAPSTGSQWELDITTLKGSIEQDLARRDFTIDAMAIELSQLAKGYPDIHIIDPINGQSDLHRGIIRAVTEMVFRSDAVRLLRAVRMAHELGFSIASETEALIKRSSHLIASVAGERVREELLRLLAIPQAEKPLYHLDKLGLLTAIIPELAQERGVEQPKEHFWNVFDHSLRTVATTSFLLREGNWEHASQEVLETAPWSAELNQHFNLEVSSGSTRGLLLKLAALLHDIAKPQTKAIDTSGRMRFLGHAKEGAAISASILERLRFSTREIKLVETMVSHHLRPTQMSQNELPSHRAIYRYFRDCGDAGIDILFLSLADHLATRGPHLNLANWQEHVKIVNYVLAQRSEQENLAAPPRLVSGHDLINILGMSPGPKIGQLLEAVREARASGELNTREEALAYIRQCLLDKDKKII